MGRVKSRGIIAGLSVCLALAGCGETPEAESFSLPIGATTWDVGAPVWFHEGTLHVGEDEVRLGERVDQYVVGATGAYWSTAGRLMFTSAEGHTRPIHDLQEMNLAVSADRSTLAAVDGSRGPTDRYGTHVLQVAVFDTRTGERLYRTPDQEPEKGADLADLYGEITPLLHGVSNDLVFFDGATIRLEDGSSVPTTLDADYVETFHGMAETLFVDGYHVGIRAEGNRRELSSSAAYGVGRLSPDRSLLFDAGMWPAPAVAYDASSGQPRQVDAPWEHFTLAGFSDADTFYGVAEDIDEGSDNALVAQQVVTCEVETLACTPVSPVIPAEEGTPLQLQAGSGQS